MENLNLLFYKTFYSKLGDDSWFDEKKKITVFENDIAAKSKKLISAKFYKEDYKPVCKDIAPDKFMLKTAYPGLLAGTGYAHGVDSASDIKLGFSIDYVTGQPYIPGSSVKGLLRSYFSYPDVIRELLGKDLAAKEVKALMLDIFEENDRSAADTDIFFDAVIRRGDENGRILGFDAITPHGEDLTKNPVPIKMIKILPDVVIEFSFRLNPSKIGEYEISPEEKTNLFKEILCTFGIGAKTNVGYGVLESYNETELAGYKWPEKNKSFSATKPTTEKPNYNNNRETQTKSIDFVKGEIYEAVVNGGNEKKIFIKIKDKPYKCFIYKDRVQAKLKVGEKLEDGDKIKVSFFKVDDYGNCCFNYEGKI